MIDHSSMPKICFSPIVQQVNTLWCLHKTVQKTCHILVTLPFSRPTFTYKTIWAITRDGHICVFQWSCCKITYTRRLFCDIIKFLIKSGVLGISCGLDKHLWPIKDKEIKVYRIIDPLLIHISNISRRYICEIFNRFTNLVHLFECGKWFHVHR